MKSLQPCKQMQEETCDQSLRLQSPSQRVTEKHTGNANKQPCLPSTPWRKSHSKGKFRYLELSNWMMKISNFGPESTPTRENGSSEKSSKKNSTHANKGNSRRRSQKSSQTGPVHTIESTQVEQQIHHHRLILLKAPNKIQEEVVTNPEEEGEEITGTEEHIPIQTPHQTSGAKLGPRKRSKRKSGRKIERIRERMERTGRSMGIQADQMGLGATVRTEEPANSIPKLPYYTREQGRYPRICRQRCRGKSRKCGQCALFLCDSPRRKIATNL